MPPTIWDTNQGGDPSHWVFSKADWGQFAELCMDKITGDILHDQDPLTSFIGHVIDAASRQHTKGNHSPTLGLTKNAGKCWRLGGPWTEKSTEEGGLG